MLDYVKDIFTPHYPSSPRTSRYILPPSPIMCKEITYMLACNHNLLVQDRCEKNPAPAPLNSCQDFVEQKTLYADVQDPATCAKQPYCSFERHNGLWDCCQCGTKNNQLGRCMTLLNEPLRPMMPCGHMCCDNCPMALARYLPGR